VECGKHFPKSELMAFADFHACAQCKPSVVAKIARGEPVGTIWRHGKQLVALVNTPLLDRCVKCNAPSEGNRLKRNFYWHHPALYFLVIFPGLLIYAIVAIIVRKRSKTEVGLCSVHRKRRAIWILSCWAAFFAGVAGVIVGANALSGNAAAAVITSSIVVMLASIITGVVMARTVAPTRITRTHVFLKGVHPDYLETLPTWTETATGA
jgi:hypothetical protein